jgi:hypothetical protein
VLNRKLQDFFDEPAILIEVEVKGNMCQVLNTDWMSQISVGSLVSL